MARDEDDPIHGRTRCSRLQVRTLETPLKDYAVCKDDFKDTFHVWLVYLMYRRVVMLHLLEMEHEQKKGTGTYGVVLLKS